MPDSTDSDALEAARVAVAVALPAIEKALCDPAMSARGVLHLVVLQRAGPPGPFGATEAVRYEQSIGDRSRWDKDHASVAMDMAALSWRHQMESRRVLPVRHHWLCGDEQLLWGGVWLDGIVAAASGARPAWNEAFALMVASNLRALALEGRRC